MAVRARADSVDAAVSSAANVSSVLAMIISFCVNAVVEPPALHVVFNSTAGLSRREFMEVFVPDETGLPRIGRWIDMESAFAFGQAAFASPEAPRLFRALAQYQAALKYWNTGSRVLVLDEPLAGLSASEVEHVAEILRDFRAAGVTVIVIEHQVRFIFDICDEVTVLSAGAVVASGSAAEVREDARVREVYLGQ